MNKTDEEEEQKNDKTGVINVLESGRFGRTKQTYIESVSNLYNKNNTNDTDTDENEQQRQKQESATCNDDDNKTKTKLTNEEIQYVEWSTNRKELLLHFLKTNHNIQINSVETFLNTKPLEYGISAQRMFRKFIYPKQKSLINIFKREERYKDGQIINKACIRTAANIAFLIEEHQKKLKEQELQQNQINDEFNTTSIIDNNTDNNNAVKPVVLILDNLRSGFNVGSILRIAETSSCSKVCACGITPYPGILSNDTKLLQRTACGAENIVPIQYYNTTYDAINYYKNNMNYYIYALEEGVQGVLTTPYCHVNINNTSSYNGIALVIGAECIGITNDTIKLCHECIEIPMLGLKTSLNVSTATSIVVFEIMRILGRFDRFKKNKKDFDNDTHDDDDSMEITDSKIMNQRLNDNNVAKIQDDSKKQKIDVEK